MNQNLNGIENQKLIEYKCTQILSARYAIQKIEYLSRLPGNKLDRRNISFCICLSIRFIFVVVRNSTKSYHVVYQCSVCRRHQQRRRGPDHVGYRRGGGCDWVSRAPDQRLLHDNQGTRQRRTHQIQHIHRGWSSLVYQVLP